MDKILIFQFNEHGNLNEDLWFNLKNINGTNILHCKYLNISVHQELDFKVFRIGLFEWLDHHHYHDIKLMRKDIKDYPTHDIIYDWLLYNFCKEDSYTGTCIIKIEDDKIYCSTLNTEANISDDLELIIKKLKGFKKIE